MKKILLTVIISLLLLNPFNVFAQTKSLEIQIIKLQIQVLQLQIQRLLILLEEVLANEGQSVIQEIQDIQVLEITQPIDEYSTTTIQWEDPQTKGCRTVEEDAKLKGVSSCPAREGICICH